MGCKIVSVPAGALPADLEASLMRLLEGEIAQVIDDWRHKWQWFVRSAAAVTDATITTIVVPKPLTRNDRP